MFSFTTYRAIPIVALLMAFEIVAAQPQSAGASAPAASGPRMGMGMGGKGGMGMGGGMGGGMQGHRMRADANNTEGWGMMSAKERDEHRKHMMDMKSPDECKAYMDKHHEEMMARAKERGVKAPGQPRRDMCAGMK